MKDNDKLVSYSEQDLNKSIQIIGMYHDAGLRKIGEASRICKNKSRFDLTDDDKDKYNTLIEKAKSEFDIAYGLLMNTPDIWPELVLKNKHVSDYKNWSLTMIQLSRMFCLLNMSISIERKKEFLNKRGINDGTDVEQLNKLTNEQNNMIKETDRTIMEIPMTCADVADALFFRELFGGKRKADGISFLESYISLYQYERTELLLSLFGDPIKSVSYKEPVKKSYLCDVAYMYDKDCDDMKKEYTNVRLYAQIVRKREYTYRAFVPIGRFIYSVKDGCRYYLEY